MACGKPPDPDHMTPPEDIRQPILQPAQQCLREIRQAIENAQGGKELDADLKRAARIIERVEQAGIAGQTVARLKDQLHTLEQQAVARVRQLGTGLNRETSLSTITLSGPPTTISATRTAPIICSALTDPKNSLHDLIAPKLIEYVRGNQQISQVYRNQLPKDIAEVLKVTPNALGLVNQAVHRGQVQPLASRSKLGSGTGYVYEIMGTAALIRQTSQPSNQGGRPLSITAGSDKVQHGIKLQGRYFDSQRELYQARKTVEADIIIQKPGGRDIAVDFKHVKGGGSVSDKGGREATRRGESDLATQIFGIKAALKTGEIHEFHFATNGRFGNGFKEAVETANRDLAQGGHAPISLHENVIASDLRTP